MPKIPTYTLAWSPTTGPTNFTRRVTAMCSGLSLTAPPGLPGWIRCPPLPSPARTAATPHARKPDSVVTATGLPTSERESSSPKNIWARRPTSRWHALSISQGCCVLRVRPTYLLPSLWQQVRTVGWMPPNVPCLPSGTLRSIPYWRPSSMYPPADPPGAPRSLDERLQQGMERALTLVSAPAGFGKTTLLAQWLAERTRLSPGSRRSRRTTTPCAFSPT